MACPPLLSWHSVIKVSRFEWGDDSVARQEFGLKAVVIAGVAVVTATVVLAFGTLSAECFRTAKRQGTRFHIRLPLLAPAATEEAAA